jgi:hypothetical protein
MFIKCATIILYILSLFFLVFFSFDFSLDAWSKGKNLDFLLLMLLIILLIVLIVIACFNLMSTIKTWQEMKRSTKELDQIID